MRFRKIVIIFCFFAFIANTGYCVIFDDTDPEEFKRAVEEQRFQAQERIKEIQKEKAQEGLEKMPESEEAAKAKIKAETDKKNKPRPATEPKPLPMKLVVFIILMVLVLGAAGFLLKKK